jgi:hypothetical protein
LLSYNPDSIGHLVVCEIVTPLTSDARGGGQLEREICN